MANPVNLPNYGLSLSPRANMGKETGSLTTSARLYELAAMQDAA